jgi:hypothetical protein
MRISFTSGCLPLVNLIPAASSTPFILATNSGDTVRLPNSKSVMVLRPTPASSKHAPNPARC